MHLAAEPRRPMALAKFKKAPPDPVVAAISRNDLCCSHAVAIINRTEFSVNPIVSLNHFLRVNGKLRVDNHLVRYNRGRTDRIQLLCRTGILFSVFIQANRGIFSLPMNSRAIVHCADLSRLITPCSLRSLR